MPCFENLIGYSTGALALGNWRQGIQISKQHGLSVIELSALRLPELHPMVEGLADFDLSVFSHVSVHLPSKYGPYDEADVLAAAEKLVALGFQLLVHPDVLYDSTAWKSFGPSLVIENMDKRKPCGRTVKELEDVFSNYTEASFCFDFGHARQIDPTMSQATSILERFGSRLREIHFSDVDAASHHRLLNRSALTAFAHIRDLILNPVPVILETLVSPDEVQSQLLLAEEFFGVNDAVA